jgi:hypothetical protein
MLFSVSLPLIMRGFVLWADLIIIFNKIFLIPAFRAFIEGRYLLNNGMDIFNGKYNNSEGKNVLLNR